VTVETPTGLSAKIANFLASDSSEPYLLLCGDAAQVLRLLPAEGVHACMTSPPYWAQREYSGPSDLGNEPRVEEYVERLVSILGEVRRVLRADGSLYVMDTSPSIPCNYARYRSKPPVRQTALSWIRSSAPAQLW